MPDAILGINVLNTRLFSFHDLHEQIATKRTAVCLLLVYAILTKKMAAQKEVLVSSTAGH